MRLNFDQPIRNLAGEAIQVDDSKGGKKDMTLAYVACEALLAPNAQDSGEKKAAAYALATRAYKGGEIDITVEEAALIKAKVGEIFAPIVVGPVFAMLDLRASVAPLTGRAA